MGPPHPMMGSPRPSVDLGNGAQAQRRAKGAPWYSILAFLRKSPGRANRQMLVGDTSSQSSMFSSRRRRARAAPLITANGPRALCRSCADACGLQPSHRTCQGALSLRSGSPSARTHPSNAPRSLCVRASLRARRGRRRMRRARADAECGQGGPSDRLPVGSPRA